MALITTSEFARFMFDKYNVPTITVRRRGQTTLHNRLLVDWSEVGITVANGKKNLFLPYDPYAWHIEMDLSSKEMRDYICLQYFGADWEKTTNNLLYEVGSQKPEHKLTTTRNAYSYRFEYKGRMISVCKSYSTIVGIIVDGYYIRWHYSNTTNKHLNTFSSLNRHYIDCVSIS